ncbi:MAG: 50S ribosomal protein L17 [Bacteroidales bacterium]
MRHRKGFNHLGRQSAHRKAMLGNMASSLIMHKRINTTQAKAKALKKFLEPLITKAKVDNTHNRREVFRKLQDKDAVSELFRNVIVKVGERPGGYTRILRTGNRLGDNAEMCIIELVDYNENMLAAKEEAQSKKKRTRRGRSGAKKKETAQVETAESKPKQEVQAETEKPKAETKPAEEKADKPKAGKKESKPEADTEKPAGDKNDEKKDKE